MRSSFKHRVILLVFGIILGTLLYLISIPYVTFRYDNTIATIASIYARCPKAKIDLGYLSRRPKNQSSGSTNRCTYENFSKNISKQPWIVVYNRTLVTFSAYYFEKANVVRVLALKHTKECQPVLCIFHEKKNAAGDKTGYLRSHFGHTIGRNRIAGSLRRVDPEAAALRHHVAHRLINPKIYHGRYFGYNLHMDQNEKLVMFGVTLVLAMDGFSGMVVGDAVMVNKNNIVIYEKVYRQVISKFGLWKRVLVDHGKEFFLTLYMHMFLHYEMGYSDEEEVESTYKQMKSTRNNRIERLWVCVNQQVVYPIKRCIADMVERNLVDSNDDFHMFSVGEVIRPLVRHGLKTWMCMWNDHIVPGRGRPSDLAKDSQTLPVADALLIDGAEAANRYRGDGGTITEEDDAPGDLLENDLNAKNRRDQIYWNEELPRMHDQILAGRLDLDSLSMVSPGTYDLIRLDCFWDCDRFESFFVECPVPPSSSASGQYSLGALKFHSVSLFPTESAPCLSLNRQLLEAWPRTSITTPPRLDPPSEQRFMHDLTMCISPMFQWIDYQKLAVFIEYYRRHGASRFLFYKRSWSDDVQRVFDHYREKSEVELEIIDWPYLPAVSNYSSHEINIIDKHVDYHGQVLAINDCGLRERFRSRFVAHVDVDEFILTLNQKKYGTDSADSIPTLVSLLIDLDASDVGSFIIEHVRVHSEELAPIRKNGNQTGLVIDAVKNRYFNVSKIRALRSPNVDHFPTRSKSIIKPDKVLRQGIHFVWSHESGFRKKVISNQLALFYHMTPLHAVDPKTAESLANGQSTSDKAEMEVFRKFMTAIEPRVNEVIQKSFNQ